MKILTIEHTRSIKLKDIKHVWSINFIVNFIDSILLTIKLNIHDQFASILLSILLSIILTIKLTIKLRKILIVCIQLMLKPYRFELWVQQCSCLISVCALLDLVYTSDLGLGSGVSVIVVLIDRHIRQGAILFWTPWPLLTPR